MFFDLEALNNCSSSCQDSSCNAKCFADSSQIIQGGKLNKSVILSGISHYGPESVWEELIEQALDKCESSVNSKPDLEEKLVELFGCVKKEASEDCPEYQSLMGCSRVEKYVEDCHRAEDCSAWPRRFGINTIIACCNTPDLVSHAERRDCSNKCTFAVNPFNCSEVCALSLEKFVKDGKLDVKEVKAALNENRNQSVSWEKSIDDAVEACVKRLKGE